MANRVLGMEPLNAHPQRWVIQIDGDELSRLQEKYRDAVAEEELDLIRDTAAKILAQCPNPASSSGRATCLALGKVQSGKTLSYTTLIALAIDNRYRITVVLAGTKNPLLEQSYSRVCRDLDASRLPLTSFRNPEPHDAEVIENVLRLGGHALIVVLKHRRRIDPVRQILQSPELNRYPTLVIDDEGDEASLNTQFRRGNRSATYASILQLRDALTIHAYIAYTATPQAPLLISGIDGLSPDYGVLVRPGNGYCGGSVFFGPGSERYIRDIPEPDADQEIDNGLPESLRNAIAIFLVGGAIRHLREPVAWHSMHSMLIHTSNLRADHQRLRGSVQQLISNWKDTLGLPDTDPTLVELSTLFRHAYDDLCQTVANPPTWEEVRHQLGHEVLTEVWMVNSLPLGRDPIATPFRLSNNILVGGNMLGRGVTIEGLAITYITRRAKKDTNADTMEQRARWFGYKMEYLDICRIFLSSQLRDEYRELLIHEDDFWEALMRNERQGLTIREWPRMLRLDMSTGLRPTRQNVANFRRFFSTGSGWEAQTRPSEDQNLAGINIEIIREFFNNHRPTARLYGHVTHDIIPDCSLEVIIRELLARIKTAGTDWENEYIIEYLSRLLLGQRLERMDVLLMAGDEGGFKIRDKRSKNGSIEPFQGPDTHRDASDANYYPGDRNIHNNCPQLQVFLIRLEGDNVDHPTKTTALALYIPPDDPRYDLRAVVRDEEP